MNKPTRLQYICTQARICTERGGCEHSIKHEWIDIDCDEQCDGFRWDEEVHGYEPGDALCKPVLQPKTITSLWSMFWIGCREARSLGLDKWENWTPLYYYIGATYLIAGFIVGLLSVILWQLAWR